jgi:hypothetical protein
MKIRWVSIRSLRQIVASTLMLWCAGAGCMLVSYTHAAALTRANLSRNHFAMQSASGIAASMATHSCCKVRRPSAQRHAGAKASLTKLNSESSSSFEQVALPEEPVPSGAMSCCPLRSGSFVVTQAHSGDTYPSVLASKNTHSPVPTNLQPAPRVYPLRLPTQNQTYLRVCAFLI